MCIQNNLFLLIIIIILPWRTIYATKDSKRDTTGNVTAIAKTIFSNVTAIDNDTNTYVTAIEKCFEQDFINITMPDGSQSDNKTIRLPESLANDYVYEIMYNTSIMLTKNVTRSCVCGLRQCIQLCSYEPHDLYDDMLKNNRSSEDMEIFYIYLTLSNGTMVRRHLIHDFQSIIYNGFCESSYSLSPEVDSKNSWAFFENETLLRHHDDTYLTGGEYCFNVDVDDFAQILRINPFNCIIENSMSTLEVANNTTMLISIPFFLLTILSYCMISELWNIHGKCLISYLSSITLSYSLLSFMNLTGIQLEFEPCIFLGFLNHYLQLAHYTWLAIICYDTWKSVSNLTDDASYSRYARFGWLMPLLWTIVTLSAQILDLPEYLKPGITAQHCGLEVNKWAASIYLYGPCLVVLLFCLFSFIFTSRLIKRNYKDVQPYYTGYEGPKSRYTLYLRLFVLMGLSWFLDVVSYLLAMFGLATSSYLMDLINAVQGVYIFINFIGRQHVRDILKEKFLCTIQKGSYTTRRSSEEYMDRSVRSLSSNTKRSMSINSTIS